MSNTIVRLESVTIENFKNVSYGKLDLIGKKKLYKSNVLGLYGQNGSGKTALIDALNLLKHAICGMPISYRFADYINVNCEYATLSFQFLITVPNSVEEIHATYSLSLKKVFDDTLFPSVDNGKSNAPKYKAVIFNERFAYSVYVDNKSVIPLKPLIDTSSSELAFEPKTKYDILVGKDKELEIDLIVEKKLVSAMSKSFVFSPKLLQAIKVNCKDERHLFVLGSLLEYAHRCLFVFDTTSNAIISFNALPLAFSIQNNNQGTAGNIVIPMDGNGLIPESAFEIVNNVVDNMNIVLNQLVPGLTISVKKLGTELLPDSSNGLRIQMLSLKNGKEIPLCYESEGIKKIVSILQLLIVVYNRESITVAIDELDAGVFEYLLGELLRIISEKGKGQLIFTSHNLRPLETLDKSFIAFTTTNPNNRYIRLSNVKTTNNLRDFYYRDITLGEQSEEVYESTNNHEIALAFKEAGDFCGS